MQEDAMKAIKLDIKMIKHSACIDVQNVVKLSGGFRSDA